MKALRTEITDALHSYIAVIERNEPYFKSPFHFHPELELVYVKEGYGTRIIGDRLDSFADGDMVFLGSNLPHVWLNDEIFYKGFTHLKASSIVIYFNKEVFSKGFYELKESSKITDLFMRAERGIRIIGKSKQLIAKKMEAITRKKDFEKIIELLEILHIISTSKEIEYIAHEGYSGGSLLQSKPDRLSEVYHYVAANYNKDISLNEISKIANLTPQAFCRLFKQRNNRHFVEYLNEVRISNTCKYLLETNLNISEIAFHCGYKTLSNFNKFFKKTTGLSPKQYREKARV
ncbi:MAG: AraC family transcriptional regulator [Bacteroidetes bacterium]|nr:AraC family transcriptional regulator [Bacteroidota bacterium]